MSKIRIPHAGTILTLRRRDGLSLPEEVDRFDHGDLVEALLGLSQEQGAHGATPTPVPVGSLPSSQPPPRPDVRLSPSQRQVGLLTARQSPLSDAPSDVPTSKKRKRGGDSDSDEVTHLS